jgi:hypothetical protein
MSLYPVVAGAGDVFGEDGLMLAVRLEDVVPPLRNGALPGAGGGSALVVGGTERIRPGEPVVFCEVVAVAPAVVRRDGKVQAAGSPAAHATLGPLEKWLEDWAGRGAVEEVAGRAVLDPRFVKGMRERLLARAFMIRAIVLMTLMPDAGLREAVLALAGDLAMVPWAPAVAGGAGAGAGRLAERARPGPAGGTAVRRAGGVPPGAPGAGLAGSRRRTAEGVLPGRDADPGPGHAREPGSIRLGRHG